jgi:hypothetical protein
MFGKTEDQGERIARVERDRLGLVAHGKERKIWGEGETSDYLVVEVGHRPLSTTC